MGDRIYKGLLWTGLTAILVFTPLARGAVRIWSITPLLLVVFLLLFAWLLKVNNTRKTKGPIFLGTALDKPILLFVIIAFISFLFSIYKYASLQALMQLFAYIGIYYLIVNNYSRGLRRYITGLVILVGAGLSVYGLLQYFGVLPHKWWMSEGFLAATYVNHNHFAGYLELVIPVAIGALIHYRSRSLTLRLGLIEAVIVMAAAFVLAQSRGAWISLAVSLIVMYLVLIKQKILTPKSIFILLTVIVVIFSFAYFKKGSVAERIDSIGEMRNGEVSLETRFKIWGGTAGMIAEKPLTGTGIGTFVWGFTPYRPEELYKKRTYYAHNDYLHMASEMGLLAIPVMLLMLVRVIGRGFSGDEHNPVILGCAAGVLSLALHGMVDFNFHIPANMLLFTIYAAIIMKEA